jgi:hypothetical protein
VTGQPGVANPYNITAQHQKLSIAATGNTTANATGNATKGAKPGISLDVSYYIAPAPDGSHYMQTKFAISIVMMRSGQRTPRLIHGSRSAFP